MNGVKVGAQPTKEAQQDQGDEEEEEGDRHRGVGDDLQGKDVSVLWRPDQTDGHVGILSKRISEKHPKGPYLSFGDVHENGKAGHVVTLTADVAVVPVEQLTSFGGPAARASNPNHQQNLLETIPEQTEQTSLACDGRASSR